MLHAEAIGRGRAMPGHRVDVGSKEPQLRAEFMWITPELAQEWINKSPNNFRTLKERTAKNYERDMAADRWHVNGQSIVISLRTGQVVDGQHRLHAIVRSGKAIMALVAWVFDERGIDRGANRTFAQILVSLDVEHASLTAAGLRTLYRLGRMRELTTGNAEELRITDDVLIDYLNQLGQEGIANVAHLGRQMKNTKKITGSLWFALMYCFLIADSDLAQEFHEGILTGANLNSSGPLCLLHNRLIQELGKGRISTRMSLRVMAALVIKTWNACRQDKTLGTLKFSVISEAFPLIDGFDYEVIAPKGLAT